MNKRSKYRTPKRLLSVFLSILMLLSSFVFVNPTISEAINSSAATSFRYSVSGKNGSSLGFWGGGASSTNFTTTSDGSIATLNNGNFIVYSYYDFRDGASNQNLYLYFTDYYHDLDVTNNWDARYNGNPKKTGEIVKPATVNSGATATQGTVAESTLTFSAVKSNKYTSKRYDNSSGRPTYYTVYDYNEGNTYYANYSVTVKVVYYGINTTRLYDLYNQYKDEYGLSSYSDIYTGASWNNYISAMANAKKFYEGKVTGSITQTDVVDAETKLINAVKNLQYLSMDLPSTLYSSGEGYGYSNRPEKVQYYSNLEFDVDLYEGYTQSVPTVTVNGKTYNGTKTDSDTYHFVIPVEKSIDKVVVNNVVKNKYTVTVPSSATGLSITNSGSHTVTHGENLTFTVTKQTGYTQKTPVVKVNGVAATYTQNGNTYTYTISNVKENKTVTIDGQSVNTYKVNYNLGEGVTKSSDSATTINHFASKTVTIIVGAAYTQSVPGTYATNGTLSAPTVNGNTYTYTLSGVTADTTIVVPALKKNTYKAVLPTGTGYKVTNEKADSNNVVNGIVYGDSLSFGIDLDKQYDRSKVVVKYNGTVLEPTGGVYTINNITNDIVEGDITVEGVELNHYYITLPLETETGFTIVVGEGLNAKSVLSGTDFSFKFFLDPAYGDSTPVIKYSADGGNTYNVLTPDENGNYTIKKVLSDCIVVVEGVKKNTYNVKFLDDSGKVLEEHKDVEYGSEVNYNGETPTKPSEIISVGKDADGNTVTVERRYKFIGWSADTSNVVSNMEVTPIFEVYEVTTTTPKDGGDSTEVIVSKTANILFVSDGVIVHKESVEKGKDFLGWDGVPTKTSKNPYEKYEFVGWDTDRDGKVDVAAGESTAIENVQNDVMFEAVFKSNLPSQVVNFYTFDGSKLLYGADFKRGEKAEYGLSGIPSRIDNTNLYEFAGWALTKDADETAIVENIIVGESDINLYAAYKKTPIVYSYKYINDGVVLQEGTFNNGDTYKYLGATPVRESTASTVYTFDGWNVKTSGYETIYTATYTESVREYETNLPASDGTFDISDNTTVKYGDTFTFTVTTKEGYTDEAPYVTSAGEKLEAVSKNGNEYTYEIKVVGETAEEVMNKLTVTVGTTINVYDVTLEGDEGCEVDPLHFDSKHGGEGTFVVTLKEGYTQNDPTLSVEGDVEVTLVSAEGGKYTYIVKNIKSDAKITVSTKINEYNVVMKDSDKDSTVVFEGKVKHGETPKYTNPTKDNDKFGGYTFIGWDLDGDGVKDVDRIENVTCDINAVAVYECNHTHAEDPDSGENSWVLDSIEKATCTKDGVKHYKCSYPECKETKDVVIKARGHHFGDWKVTVAPTCTKDGTKVRYCTNAATDEYEACTHSESAVVAKLGHAYGEWVTIVVPTCTEKGKAERVCANDHNHKEYKDIDATGHHDSDEDYKCDDCGADLGHCSSCVCHKGNVLSKVIRKVCTILSKVFRTEIKCCKCMEWYGDEISSIS